MTPEELISSLNDEQLTSLAYLLETDGRENPCYLIESLTDIIAVAMEYRGLI